MVIQVQARLAGDDSQADRCHGVVQRHTCQNALVLEVLQRGVQGHVSAADRGRTGAAVRLYHVTVQPHRALTELLEIDHGAQRAPDEALDFKRSAALPATCHLARCACMGGARQHGVLGAYPAAAAVTQEARHRFLHRRGTAHLGIAHRDQSRAFGVLGHARGYAKEPQLVAFSAVGSHGVPFC